MKHCARSGNFWVCIAVCAVALFAFATASFAQFTPALKQLIPLAKKEGEVSIFIGTVKCTAEEEERFSKAFAHLYGIPMKVHLASIGDHPMARRRLLEEARTGIKPMVDVFNTGIKGLQELADEGLFLPTNWKELGILDEDLIKRVNLRGKDPIDAVYMSTNIRGVIYNTKLVKPGDAPRKFEDLLDPKWKGKIIAPAFPSAFPYIALVIGEQASLKLVKQLVEEQKLAFAPSYTAGSDKAKGAPVENAPMKVAGFRQGAQVLKNAAHPAAAKLLVHFMTSTPEGAKVMDEILDWGKRNMPGSEAYDIAKGGGLVFSSDITNEIEWETKDNIRIGKLFEELLGL
jgi:ABC-type Fe3+ transport system substrate-binding protein